MNKHNEAVLEMYSNPTRIQHDILKNLEEKIAGGNGLITPNNTCSFFLDSFSTISSNIVNDTIKSLNSVFPVRATSSEDLYKHMSDFDYLGLYAIPSATNIEFIINMDILHDAPVDTESGFCKAIIPKDSIFLVGNYTYSLHYPIEIRFNSNTYTATVVYDDTIKNPMFSLASYLLESRNYNVNGVKLLSIKIPVYQFERTYFNEELFKDTPFVKEYPFTDEFYAVRLYTNKVYENYSNEVNIDYTSNYIDGTDVKQNTIVDPNEEEEWTEIHQTLSSKVYDITDNIVPTSIINIDLENKLLKITIPYVYISNNSLGSKLKIELLTTKGEVDIDTSLITENLIPSKFPLTGYESTDNYSSMLTDRTNVNILLLDSRITGGKFGMEYTDLRRRIIYNTFNDQLLVTPMDLIGYFEDIDLSFNVTKFKDGITSRIYLCNKELRDLKKAVVPSGEITTLIRSDRIISDDNHKIKSIRRFTDGSFLLTPDVMYKYDKISDTCEPMLDTDIEELENKQNILWSKESFIENLNDNTYTYNPFYTKLSIINDIPIGETFELESPIITNRRAEDEAGGNIQLSLNNISITTERVPLSELDDEYSDILKYYLDIEIKVSTIADESLTINPSNIKILASTINTNNNTVYIASNTVDTEDTFSDSGLYTFRLELNSTGWIKSSKFIEFDFDNGKSFINLNSNIIISMLISNDVSDDEDGINNNYIPIAATSGYKTFTIYNLDIEFGKVIKELFTGVDVSYDNKIFDVYTENKHSRFSHDTYLKDGDTIVEPLTKIQQIDDYQYDKESLTDMDIIKDGDNIQIDMDGETYYGYIKDGEIYEIPKVIKIIPTITADYLEEDELELEVLGLGDYKWVKNTVSILLEGGDWILKKGSSTLVTNTDTSNNIVPTMDDWDNINDTDIESMSIYFEDTPMVDIDNNILSDFIILNRSDIDNISSTTNVDSSTLVRTKILDDSISTSYIVSIPLYSERKGEVITLADESTTLLDRIMYYRIYMIHLNKRVLYGDLKGYANYDDATHYISSMKKLIIDNCNIVATTKPRLLPNTDIYYRPSKSIGLAVFKVSSSLISQFDLEIGINFKLFVIRRVASSEKIMQSIRQNVINIVDDFTVKSIFSLTELANEIVRQLGNFVKSVDIYGLNSNLEHQTLIHADEGTVLNLKHILVYNNNTGAIDIERAIGFQFIIADAEGSDPIL